LNSDEFIAGVNDAKIHAKRREARPSCAGVVYHPGSDRVGARRLKSIFITYLSTIGELSITRRVDPGGQEWKRRAIKTAAALMAAAALHAPD
jgi:hypothetical protein